MSIGIGTILFFLGWLTMEMRSQQKAAEFREWKRKNHRGGNHL